jgi:hypothetical protein
MDMAAGLRFIVEAAALSPEDISRLADLAMADSAANRVRDIAVRRANLRIEEAVLKMPPEEQAVYINMVDPVYDALAAVLDRFMSVEKDIVRAQAALDALSLAAGVAGAADELRADGADPDDISATWRAFLRSGR